MTGAKVVGLGLGLSMAMLPYDWPFVNEWPDDSESGKLFDACEGVVLWAILLDAKLDTEGCCHAASLGDAYLLEGWRHLAGVGFDAPLSECREPAAYGLEATAGELRPIAKLLSSARGLAALLEGRNDEMSLFLADYYLHGGWMRWPSDGSRDVEWRNWRLMPRQALGLPRD